MPELSRRRYRERQDCWHVYFGDVHVGTIARRVGIPHHGRPWGWICGFYPGSEPGEFRDGTAATFDQARADFRPGLRLCKLLKLVPNAKNVCIIAFSQVAERSVSA